MGAFRGIALVPPERRPRERRPLSIFGLEIGCGEREVDLDRIEAFHPPLAER